MQNQLMLNACPIASKRIPLIVFAEHVEFRNQQTCAGLTGFAIDDLAKWFSAVSWDQHYKGHEPFCTNGNVTEVACITVANAIINDDLRRLVTFDILTLFGGLQNSIQMVNSGMSLPTDLAPIGSYGDIPFEPPGCKPFYFPNGVRGLSSKYLEEVGIEMSRQGLMGDKKPKRHDDLCKKIRTEMERISGGVFLHLQMPNSYYDMAETTYVDSRGKTQILLIMSPDLTYQVLTKIYNISSGPFIRNSSICDALNDIREGEIWPIVKDNTKKYVYFFNTDLGVKIGHSYTPHDRIAFHQKYFNITEYYIVDIPILNLEKTMHDKFKQYVTSNKEIFSLDITEVKTFLWRENIPYCCITFTNLEG